MILGLLYEKVVIGINFKNPFSNIFMYVQQKTIVNSEIIPVINNLKTAMIKKSSLDF